MNINRYYLLSAVAFVLGLAIAGWMTYDTVGSTVDQVAMIEVLGRLILALGVICLAAWVSAVLIVEGESMQGYYFSGERSGGE